MQTIFTYLIVFGIIWFVGYILRKAGKNAQAAQKSTNNLAKQPSTSTPKIKLEQILSDLLGEDYISQNQGELRSTRNQEAMSEEVRLENSFDGYENSQEEGGSLIIEKEEKISEGHQEKVQINHPYISGFDPKKALVYSEILQPKYF